MLPHQKPSSRIEIGRLLADRFVITRLLGTGGMGAVYEAEDQTLGESVALKVIQTLHQGSNADKRLLREVQLARRVTHRNVCRIFDLICHFETPEGPPLDLVSMELLIGETLADRFKRGPLPLDEAEPIIRQIARGLHAAHSLGIVHRDLKPSNVMLSQEPLGLRATITDFGLAQTIFPDGPPETALTQEGKIVGTPAYMTPEQLTGDKTSPATDLYNLGLIFFEALSGRLPFSGETPWQMALARLMTDPVSLDIYCPEIDSVVLKIVDRCLERDPKKRWESAVELLEFMDRGDSSWNLYGIKSEEDDAHSTQRNGSDFLEEAKSPNREPPSDVVEGELEGDRWKISRSIAIALLSVLMITFLVFGLRWSLSDTPPPSNFGLSADSLEWSQTDRVLHDLPVPGGEVASPVLPAEEMEERGLAIANATSLLSVKDIQLARESFEPAAAKWPEDALVNSKMAEILWFAGEDEEAKSAIDKAVLRIGGLAREDRLLIEAFHYGFNGDWDRARETFREVWQATRSVDCGLWILRSNWMSGRIDPMPELFEELRQAPQSESTDIRIDLWEIFIIQKRGESRRAVALAREAVERAERSGHRFLEYSALSSLASSLAWQGETTEAAQVDNRLNRLADDLATPFERAQRLLGHGAKLWARGYGEEARSEYERALEIFEEIDSTRGQCFALLQMGPKADVDIEAQVELLEKGLEICSDVGLRSHQARLLHHLARLRRDQGFLSEALEYFGHSAQIFKELGDDRRMVYGRVSLALLLEKMGRLDETLAHLETALTWLRQDHDPDGLVATLLFAADKSIETGQLEQATGWLEEAKALHPTGRRILHYYAVSSLSALRSGDMVALAKSVSGLGEHARNLGVTDQLQRAAAYEGLLRSLEGRHAEGLELLASRAASQYGNWLVELHIARGDPVAASEALDTYADWAKKTRSTPHRWTAEILASILGSSTADVDQLRRVEREARAGGHLRLALEAALARARILGQKEALTKVRDSADQLGFLRISNEANQSLGIE